MTTVSVRLDSIAEVRLGRQRSPKDHEGPDMRPYVRAANVGWDGWKLDDVKSMNFTDDEMSVYRLQPGDLLVGEASGSATEVGKPAIWNGEIEECAFQNTLIRVRPRGVEPRYLLHFFKFLAGTGKFAARSRGVGINHLGSETLASWQIPLPPIEEQRRIAAILDKADDLRAKRRAALAHLDSLTQSIFLDMFGDPIANPLGWPSVPLSSLGSLDRGVSKHRPRNDPRLLGGAHPLIQTSDVANSGGWIRSFHSTYSDAGLAQSKRWPAGTLCITIAANIARTGILTFDACFPDSVVGFRSDPATTLFARTVLERLQADLERAAPESAQKNINLAVLRNLRVPDVPARLREVFAERAAVVEETNIRSGLCWTSLDELFVSLQHRAFSGQL